MFTYVHVHLQDAHSSLGTRVLMGVCAEYLELSSQSPCLQSQERSRPAFSQHVKVACSLLEQLNDKGRGEGVGGWDASSEMQLNVYSRL